MPTYEQNLAAVRRHGAAMRDAIDHLELAMDNVLHVAAGGLPRPLQAQPAPAQVGGQPQSVSSTLDSFGAQPVPPASKGMAHGQPRPWPTPRMMAGEPQHDVPPIPPWGNPDDVPPPPSAPPIEQRYTRPGGGPPINPPADGHYDEDR